MHGVKNRLTVDVTCDFELDPNPVSVVCTEQESMKVSVTCGLIKSNSIHEEHTYNSKETGQQAQSTELYLIPHQN